MKEFQITQDETLLKEGESSLSYEKLDHHLYCLPKDLKRKFSREGINIEAERVGNIVLISIPDSVPEYVLSDHLGEVNAPLGLAFGVIDDELH